MKSGSSGADNPGPYTVTVHDQATGDLLETWPVKNDKTDFEWTIDLPVGAAVFVLALTFIEASF